MRYQVGAQPIPGYRLDAFLGAGSYGEVWRAIGPGGVPCALKFISLDSKSGLKEFRSIRLVKRLQHPNLCPVQAIWLRDPDGNVLSDSGDDSISIRLMGPKELVIAMGLGQKSLAQRLEEVRNRGGIPARELLRYMSDASKGIDYLNSPEHDLGSGPASIIHCDIKPANLLIVGGGVQVCDYGVAKALAPDSKKTFAAGTPAYASPELINNEPCPHTDQYSLAVTYYELRTGRLPFDEARAIVANLMGQLDFSGVGPEEQEVLRQATHKQPVKRFESCEEFVESLKIAANITVGPSGVVPASQARRVAATPPHEEAPAAFPEPIPAAAKSLSDLLQPGGELVPDHYLTKLLGRGGYGEVWEARASGGVRCALKVVRDLQGRGKQEFAVLDTISKLDHPSLVQLRGYWLLASNGTRVMAHQVGLAGVPDPSIVVISTDLAEKNLLDRLKECKADGLPGVPPDELVSHIRQAAVALDYLNIKHHIQHRDVKPENLLLRGDRLLVSDFGLAKLVEGDDGAVQSSSSGMTLEYAAPELLQKKVSSRTDQYSLALTYYTLRTGRMPFPPGMGQFDTMQARIKGQLDLSGVPAAEQAILRKALAPNPADRFGSCDELARQLAYASGIGIGPTSSQAADGLDLSRITPTDLSPRMTPVIPSRVSKSTPNYPVETPRASTRPGEVPLTPADPGGTLLFGDLPPERGPSTPRTTPAPWVTDEPPAKPTKSDRSQPRWNESPPTSSSGSGRTAAVISGVVVLLALASAGVYYLITKDGSDTVTMSTGVTTTPTDKGNGTVVNTVSTSRTPDTLAAKITSLKAEIRKLTQAKQFELAWERVGELKVLDEAGATELTSFVKKAEELAKAPPPDDRVAKAAAFFQPDQRDITAGLDALTKVPESSPDYPRAVALRSAWERAKAAAAVTVSDSATLLKFRDDYADLRPLTNSASLTKSDRDDLQAYYRDLLSKKIRTAIPGLSDRWDEVAAICDEATKATHLDERTRAWIAACRTECQAEQNGTRDPSDPETAESKIDDPDLAGYLRYVSVLRNWRDGTDAPKRLEAAARTAVALVPKEAPKEHSWFSTRRLGRLADLLWAAHEPLRTADDKNLEHPYATGPTAEKATEWLTAASRAADLAKQPAANRTRLDYELLLANWSRGKESGDELTRLLDAKFADSLEPGAKARFGVIRATSRPAEEVIGYQTAFDALKRDGTPALRDFVARKVLTRLIANKAIDQQNGAPELLASAGHELFRHRLAWARVAELTDPPARLAAGLFERAAGKSKKADDRAWVGLCRTEIPGTPFQTLTDDLAAARKAGTGPAVQTLEALVGIRRLWAGSSASPSRTKEVDSLKESEGLLRKAIEACKSDPGDRSDELNLLLERTGTTVTRLAEMSPSEQVEAQLKKLNELATQSRGRFAALEYSGRALELRAALLKPSKRFDSVTGEYALADRDLDWSGCLFGSARSALNRGRNLVRWADDQYHNGAALDETRLDKAEELLRLTTNSANQDVLADETAEATYWLGRSALLRCEVAQQALTRANLTQRALVLFQSAADSAATLDVDYQTDTILRSALSAADLGLKAARDAKSETTAETIAKRIDALTNRKTGRPLSPIWKSTFQIRAIRIREVYGAKAEGWFAKIESAALPGLKGNQDRDEDLKLELLQTLAKGYGAKEKNPKQYDLSSAIKYANESLALAKRNKDLPKRNLIESYGLLGILQFQTGNDENKYQPWTDARSNLEEALRLLAAERNAVGQEPGGKPTVSDEWKWQFALGGILARAAVFEKDEAKSADLGTHASWVLMASYRQVYATTQDVQKTADPDDKALARHFFNDMSNNWFSTARDCCRLGLKNLPNDPRRAVWQLAADELDYFAVDAGQRKKVGENLAAAVRNAKKELSDMPKETRAAVENQISRIEAYLKQVK